MGTTLVLFLNISAILMMILFVRSIFVWLECHWGVSWCSEIRHRAWTPMVSIHLPLSRVIKTRLGEIEGEKQKG